MLIPLDLFGRPLVCDDLGSRLEARIFCYRRVGDGITVNPVGWCGFRFERLRRMVVERTVEIADRPAGLSGPADPPSSSD